MNESGVVRFVEISGQRLQARNQILESGGPKLLKREFECHASRRRCIRKGAGIIESGVVRRAFVVQIKSLCYQYG